MKLKLYKIRPKITLLFLNELRFNMKRKQNATTVNEDAEGWKQNVFETNKTSQETKNYPPE